jgi:hypothetical protein
MPSIIILTRTYYKDANILEKNLCSTLNIFLNRDKYKFGIILDDESLEDHELGNKLLKDDKTDYIYYEPLPDNHLKLFQALAWSEMRWGYDRQQWSTFYMDIFAQQDIIGVVDSDSTFTSYLTDEAIMTLDGKIKIKGIKPLKDWEHWCIELKNTFIFKDGSQYSNDDFALKFKTEYALMETNIMPIFFWKETFINFRNYISDQFKMSFDEAYKIFSVKPYCQFNILANYALKFESDKYQFINLKDQGNDKISVAQNGCPTSRDTLCGLIKSFNLSSDRIPTSLIIQKSLFSSFGNVKIDLTFDQCLHNFVESLKICYS